jgi:hypothetical protein
LEHLEQCIWAEWQWKIRPRLLKIWILKQVTPDFWREDAEWQHAILESGTYYLKDPNIETLPTYFQALSDWHYPGQFPLIEPANFDIFGQQYEYFYPVDYQYSLTKPPS